MPHFNLWKRWKKKKNVSLRWPQNQGEDIVFPILGGLSMQKVVASWSVSEWMAMNIANYVSFILVYIKRGL